MLGSVPSQLEDTVFDGNLVEWNWIGSSFRPSWARPDQDVNGARDTAIVSWLGIHPRLEFQVEMR